MSLLKYFKKNYYQDHLQQPPDNRLHSLLAQNVEEDKKRYPDDTDNINIFFKLLYTTVELHFNSGEPKAETAETDMGSNPEPSPVDGTTVVYLSENHMRAYLCLLPPLNGGQGVTYEKALDDLNFEGISHGIDENLLKDIINQKLYLHIWTIAYGIPAVDGTDAVIESPYSQNNVFSLEVEEGAQIQFDKKDLFQAVHCGEPICNLIPAVAGKDGVDVTGKPLRSKNGINAKLPAGANTISSKDGLFAMAGIDGLVCMRNGLFCIDPQKIIFGHVDESVGDLDYPGNIIIKGDVHENRTIKAAGNIVIEGTVKKANLIAGGSVYIQCGIHGDGVGTIQAAKQVQCKIIDKATVTAGSSIFAEVIKDSNITTSGSVYALSGRGLLIGGQLKSRYAVKALKIGNQSGCLNIIILNYYPDLMNKVWIAQDALNTTQTTLKELKKNISAMRSKFKNLLTDEKELLSKLTEQKQLYEEKEAHQSKILATLSGELNNFSVCYASSEEIHPTTIIRLGEKSLTIKELQGKCHVHMHNGALTLR